MRKFLNISMRVVAIVIFVILFWNITVYKFSHPELTSTQITIYQFQNFWTNLFPALIALALWIGSILFDDQWG